MTTLAKVNQNLAAIVDMATRLRVRAIDKATDHLMPGGEAMVNLAGAANYEAWQHRIDTLEQPDADGISHIVDITHEDPDDRWTPEQILRWWSDQYRQQLGMEPDDTAWRPTLTTEANFLRNKEVSEWIWNNEDHWDAYAADVSRARTKMESVLLEGHRFDTAPVSCDQPGCDETRPLILINAKRHPTLWDCDTCNAVGISDPAGHEDHDLTEAAWASDPRDDRWMCKTCRHKYDADQVAEMTKRKMRLAPERLVPFTQALHLIASQGWQKRTIRSWFAPLDTRRDDKCTRCRVEFTPDEHNDCPYCGFELQQRWTRGDRSKVIEAYCELDTRRVMVRWPSLWTRHLREQQARDIAAKQARERDARRLTA